MLPVWLLLPLPSKSPACQLYDRTVGALWKIVKWLTDTMTLILIGAEIRVTCWICRPLIWLNEDHCCMDALHHRPGDENLL